MFNRLASSLSCARQPHHGRQVFTCRLDVDAGLQGNAKTQEGKQHPDLDAQFRYIAQEVSRCQKRKQPTISVDTKKKELVGDFKNGGRAWRPAGTPDRVRVHDFVMPAKGNTGGKAIPYGVYDLPTQRRVGESGDRS